MSDYYTRDGRPTTSTAGFNEDRKVARTAVPEADAEVSTVFLVIDHSHGDGPPLIFESMVFGGRLDQHCERYSTEAEAKAGHDRIVTTLRSEGVAWSVLKDNQPVRDAARLLHTVITAHLRSTGLDDGDMPDEAITAYVREVTR